MARDPARHQTPVTRGDDNLTHGRLAVSGRPATAKLRACPRFFVVIFQYLNLMVRRSISAPPNP
jgi:hypothetical protein